MRRNRRGSSDRLATGLRRGLAPVMLSVAVTLSMPGLANADPGAQPDTTAKLIADVAQANQRMQDLGAQIQIEEESVNNAVVDVQTARDSAAAAQREVDASQQA